VCACACVKRFIINNWLMQLSRWASPRICRVSWQAGDPGKPMIQFHSKGWQAPDLGRAGVSVQIQRQEERKEYPSLKAVRQEEVSY